MDQTISLRRLRSSLHRRRRSHHLGVVVMGNDLELKNRLLHLTGLLTDEDPDRVATVCFGITLGLIFSDLDLSRADRLRQVLENGSSSVMAAAQTGITVREIAENMMTDAFDGMD